MATTWNEPEDQRKSGLKYPNYNAIVTDSGHEIVIDDSEGAESITFKHRSGTFFQFQADGSMVVRSAGAKYEVTFGDNNMLVTGGQNVTVNGDQAVKIDGKRDEVISDDVSSVIQGDYEAVVSGNKTSTVKGDAEEVITGNKSTKVAGNQEILGDKTFISGGSKIGIHSGGSVSIAGEAVGIEGDTTFANDVAIQGDESISGDLDVAGTTNVQDINIAGDILFSGNLSLL